MTQSDPGRPRLLVDSRVPLTAHSARALEASAFGPFELWDAPPLQVDLTAGPAPAALIVAGDLEASADASALMAAADCAVLVVVETLGPEVVLHWLERGAQDVLLAEELDAPTLPMRLRAAIERHRAARDARTVYSTDLGTGLPHRQQLIEHMSQLIALREREPAPMALIVLRIEGLATTAARLGREASNVLRRKLGVRLRAGVRASDVVAALGDDSFAVLLGSLLSPGDAVRVGEKLVTALQEPLRVAGHDIAVATALGIAQHPQDGTLPDALLRRALGLAAAATAQGRARLANFDEAGGPSAAANDD
jgi:diguanylate cyclase (GGDEF)-like protein